MHSLPSTVHERVQGSRPEVEHEAVISGIPEAPVCTYAAASSHAMSENVISRLDSFIGIVSFERKGKSVFEMTIPVRLPVERLEW